MLGTGRPFVMEVQNMRAAMPGLEYFADAEDRLQKVNSFAEDWTGSTILNPFTSCTAPY